MDRSCPARALDAIIYQSPNTVKTTDVAQFSNQNHVSATWTDCIAAVVSLYDHCREMNIRRHLIPNKTKHWKHSLRARACFCSTAIVKAPPLDAGAVTEKGCKYKTK